MVAFIYAIQEINQREDLLPNITLGYRIFDSASNEHEAILKTFLLMSGGRILAPNYICQEKRMVAFIGDLGSATSRVISVITGIYHYPQISYGSMDTTFTDRVRFPFLYRTVPNERYQHIAIVQLLKHFGWIWVGIVISDDESSHRGSQDLLNLLARNGICVEFLWIYGTDEHFSDIESQFKTIRRVRKSSAKVVIFYCNKHIFDYFIETYTARNYPDKIWINLSMSFYFVDKTMRSLVGRLKGTLAFSVRKGEIPGLRDALLQSPQNHPHNSVIAILCFSYFGCFPPTQHFDYGNKRCPENITLRLLPQMLYDVENFRITYSIYMATYLLAQALHSALGHLGGPTANSHLSDTIKPWQLKRKLKGAYFLSSSGEKISFTSEGDVPGVFDITNWVGTTGVTGPTLTPVTVGHFNSSAPEGQQLRINDSDIHWNPRVIMDNFSSAPSSVCSERCSPGYRKALRQGHPICCYDCVPCAEGQISNSTDSDNCITCHESEWSNKKKDMCIPRTVDFLSHGDYLGSGLVSLSVVSAVVTCSMLCIFCIHNNTPVVKANNRELSYILLLSIFFSFLCVLLFIGRPQKVTCLLRQVTFGINFTLSVSCVLAKTVTVVIAFNATKPGSKIKKWVGTRVSIWLVLLCSLVQVGICLVWLISSPPFPDYDTHTYTGKMILQCNEGSVTAFYTVIGYMGFLSALSFIVAFLVRKLPDSFNEAQLITFSMLVFCSVWVSFIPAYLSTKGKYTVAVEIFAILTSSAGLLGCIFIPKCHIILFHPEKNTRRHLIGKLG
ncbi:hypothetical protein XELAEV_18016564mg [Xenopus laevis]|nr:hypothetical protein XELAEV_18016564mg [Xenopus laevis]